MMSFREARIRFIHHHFHALTHRNFRYLLLGQCISLIGTWTQTIAQSWLVLTLTGSPLLLGLIQAVQFIPFTCFSLFAGAIIDKFPKKRILMLTQACSMLVAFLTGGLIFTGHITMTYLLLAAFVSGLANAFDLPARQAFNIEVVGKEDLMNAVALNSSTLNLARIVGPSIGALVMLTVGAGWCFVLNGLSFLGVIYGLLQMNVTSYVRPKKAQSALVKEVAASLVYVYRDYKLLTSLLLVLITGTFCFNFNVLIPALTRSVLHLQEDAYGLLMSCLGIGSLIGALCISIKSKQGPVLTISLGCSMAVSVLLAATGLTLNYAIIGLLIALTGLFNIIVTTICNSYLQLNTPDEYRSRVMGVYSLVFVGSTPLGSLFSGLIADRYGADTAFFICGLFALVSSLLVLVLYWRQKSRAPRLA